MGGTVIQGWHSDPFGVHEARYFSADGQPTKLVRDRGVESYDEPPSGSDEVAAAMARMSAMPEPPGAYPSRDAYPYDRAAERQRGPRRPPIAGFAVTWIVAVAAAVAIVLGAQTLLRAPKPASTQGSATDVAFVTQAATRTLQQRTADLVMSASTAAGGTGTALHGTGALDLGGKSGTLNMTLDTNGTVTAFQEIMLNGYVYLEFSVNGRSLLPTGKSWIAAQASTKGMTNIGGSDPTAILASLENHGITVRALGTKVIGGVSCTGYAATVPGTQGTVTIWINPQHLVREISAETSISISADLSVAGESPSASPSASPVGTAVTGSVDLTMDFTYSAAPLRVTAPPAASTISFDAFLRQLASNPAIKQLEQSGAS